MADNDEVRDQLATRIPKALHRELKLYCVQREISMMDFIIEALEDRLAHEAGRAGRRRAS